MISETGIHQASISSKVSQRQHGPIEYVPDRDDYIVVSEDLGREWNKGHAKSGLGLGEIPPAQEDLASRWFIPERDTALEFRRNLLRYHKSLRRTNIQLDPLIIYRSDTELQTDTIYQEVTKLLLSGVRILTAMILVTIFVVPLSSTISIASLLFTVSIMFIHIHGYWRITKTNKVNPIWVLFAVLGTASLGVLALLAMLVNAI